MCSRNFEGKFIHLVNYATPLIDAIQTRGTSPYIQMQTPVSGLCDLVWETEKAETSTTVLSSLTILLYETSVHGCLHSVTFLAEEQL